MKILEDGKRIQVRVRIEGSYLGISFTYEDPENSDGSQFIWTEDNDPSTYWWSDGNFGCDCNRSAFLPKYLQDIHGRECGHTIKLDKIIPIEGDNLPILELNESDDL